MKKRTISVLLVILLLVSMFTLLVTASDNILQDSVTSPIKLSSNNFETQINGYTETEKIAIPEILLSDSSVKAEEITKVLSIENNLYSIAYANTEGVCTLKLYSHPIKYKDVDGNIRDISLNIKPCENGFKTAQNSIITEFPQKLTNGISLLYEDININLTPVQSTTNSVLMEEIDADSAKLSDDSKTISYEFGNKTHIDYELTYTGFKEEIVVEEYTGQTEYNFILKTNGLDLVNYEGSYYLEDTEGNIKATIGDIIIFTADDVNNSVGTMTHTVVKTNQIYSLTINIDKNFLNDVNTKYPIRIDPTIEIYYDNNGANAIEDVTINEVDTFRATSGSIMVGRHPEDSTLSRGLMRFPGLSLPSGLAGSQILFAYVEIRDVMAESTSPVLIDCHIYKNTAPAWSESQGANWTSVGTDYIGARLQGWVVNRPNGANTGSGESNRYRYDITSLAVKWANGLEDPNKGIVFKASDSFENQTGSATQNFVRTFASYNRASYKPSLTIIYNNPYLYYSSSNELYTNTQNEDGSYNDDRLQLRANGYAFMLQTYYEPSQIIDEYRDDGEGYYLFLGELSNAIDVQSSLYSSVREALISYHYGACLSGSWCVEYVCNLMMHDLETMGYTIEPANIYSETDVPQPTALIDKRLMLVLTDPTGYDFYIQNSDNTWSCKNEIVAPNSIKYRYEGILQAPFIVTNSELFEQLNYLTDSSVQGYVDYGYEYQFFYIQIPTNGINGHSAYNTSSDINGTQIIDQDYGGNYLSCADMTEVYDSAGFISHINYYGDIDCYSFTVPYNGEWFFKATANAYINANISLYDVDGTLLDSSTISYGNSEYVSAQLSVNNIYYFKIENTNSIDQGNSKNYEITMYEGEIPDEN